MSFATLLLAGTVLVAFTFIVVLCARSTFALNRALDGLRALENELVATRDASVERYHTEMPYRRQYDEEVHCASTLIKEWWTKLNELRDKPVHEKLTRTWCASCDEIAKRSNSAVRELQEAAFWAQFIPGSEMSEARFHGEELE